MRTIFRGAGAIATLLLAAGAASAQSLILNEPTAGQRTIPLASGSQVQILPNGNISVSAANDLECSGGGGGNRPNVNLTANPASIDRGGSSTISWNITNGFTSCTTSGGAGTSWSTLNVNSNTGSEVFSNLQGNTSFSMSCTNAAGSGSDTVVVNVGNDPGGPGGTIPAGCEGIQPAGARYAAADDFRTSGTTEAWYTFAEAYSLPWPGNSNVNRRLNVPRGDYIALKFQPSSVVGQAGRMSTELDLAGREKIMTITECPGDFRPSIPVECKRFDVFTNLFWANEDAQGNVPFGHCRLEAGKDYYLNVMFANINDPTQNLCPGSQCIFLGQMFVNQ